MPDRLILGFCPACQGLYAPWSTACPACDARMVAVWVTDARPDLIAAVAEETRDGGVLEVCLDDDAEHAALIAELLVRVAARAA